jgi:predicted DNA-binding transcriptional regulator YafY
MRRFGISRSTALRDILSLEELGVPIYTEPGRYGGYRILENRMVPPINFTNDEVFALYFAMLTLQSYASTPFHLHFESLKKKFCESISKTNARKLSDMEKILQLQSVRHDNESAYLKRLVQAAIDREIIRIAYTRNNNIDNRIIQVMEILSRDGEWYCSAYDFLSKACKVFRCDRIKGVEPCEDYEPMDFSNYTDPWYELRDKSVQYYNFKVEIDDGGVNLFRKENYPNMKLVREEGRYFITGYYGGHEKNFMARYLLPYGKTLKSIYPKQLKEALTKLSRELLQHYDRIPLPGSVM